MQLCHHLFLSIEPVVDYSRVSSVINAIIVQAGRPGNRGSIPARLRMFLFPIASRPAVGLSFLEVSGAILSGLNWPGVESDHIPTSSSEVKNV